MGNENFIYFSFTKCIFLKKPTINVRALMSLQTSESWKSAIFKILKKHSFSVMTPKKKRKKLEKFRNRNRFWLRWREKGEKRKIKQEFTVLSAHHVHIANLVMHFGMKPFPLKSLPRKYGQSSWNKTDSKHRRVLPRSRLVRGILIKFSRLLPLNRKSSSLWRTLRLTRKAILIEKKAKYVRQTLQRWHIFSLAHRVQLLYMLSKGNDAHD